MAPNLWVYWGGFNKTSWKKDEGNEISVAQYSNSKLGDACVSLYLFWGWM